ncbi:MAG: membrane protein of unknown function [Promethearchaeota archaeon]|nr:MAG: membrane protein of unknown function [Candidatus Lokiarchaeota archaeon]
MNCPNCGAQSSPNQKFCQYCGASLKSVSAEQSLPPSTSNPYVSQPTHSTQTSAPSKRVPSVDFEEKDSKKYSKRCFILAMVSFCLFLISITSGGLLYLALRNSIHFEIDIFSLLIGFPYFIPSGRYVFDEGLMGLGYIIGIMVILFSIAGFVLGIVSRRVRRTAVREESKNGLTTAGGVFAILGIIFNILTPIISILIFTTPFYVTILNLSSGYF